jgi:hypothetical protein
VTSAQKTRANRANARASTGPKTAGGRKRSARNACRHGLTLPVLADPILSQEVAELTREIAGSNPSRELYELARRMAEAQIDLRRIRHARSNFGRQLAGHLSTKPEGSQKFAILSDMTRQLAAMDRYERRALSQRKFAMRAFDVGRRQSRVLRAEEIIRYTT